MRILLLTPVFPPARGGIEVTAGKLAEHLRGKVLVATLAPGAGTVTGEQPPARPGCRVLRLPNEPRGGRRAILGLNAASLAAGLAFRPDVVLALHVKAAPAARAVSALSRAPLVQWVHAKEMREVPALARFAVQRASAVVAVSSYSSDLAREAGADAARIVTVPPGVDVPAVRRAERDARPTLVTVSRLEDRYKGHDVVLQALPAVREAVPDVRWVVVGDGGLRPELERAARDAGLSDAVRFAGGLDDAARDVWLDRASVFVMPSRAPGGDRAGEGFGIVFLEAGAHGLPVVAGRVPGVVDAVRDGTTGLLVDPTDPQAVAAAVTRVLTDPEAAARMGAAGAARAQEQAWPQVVARVQDMLEAQVAAGPSRPARPPRDWRWARDLVAAPPAP